MAVLHFTAKLVNILDGRVHDGLPLLLLLFWKQCSIP